MSPSQWRLISDVLDETQGRVHMTTLYQQPTTIHYTYQQPTTIHYNYQQPTWHQSTRVPPPPPYHCTYWVYLLDGLTSNPLTIHYITLTGNPPDANPEKTSLLEDSAKHNEVSTYRQPTWHQSTREGAWSRDGRHGGRWLAVSSSAQ